MGSLPSSRRVAIRLTRLIPRRCFPKAVPSSSAWGRQLPPAEGANPGDEDVLGDLRGNPGQVDDLPGAMGPAAGQRGPAIGAALHRVLHPVGGGHPSTGEAMGPGLLRGRGLRAGPGLEAGHPRWTAQFGFVLQLDDAPFQAANDRLLLDDDGDELVAAGGVEVDAGVHATFMTQLPRSALAPRETTFSQSTSSTLNSYPPLRAIDYPRMLGNSSSA